MTKSKYANKDTVVFEDPEKNSGELITEQGGYITVEQMVKNMMDAGRRLDAARGFQVDFDDDDPEVDKTTVKNYGFDDVHEDIKYLENKAKQAKQAKPAQQGGTTQQAQQAQAAQRASTDDSASKEISEKI